jgi:hypothetical protein
MVHVGRIKLCTQKNIVPTSPSHILERETQNHIVGCSFFQGKHLHEAQNFHPDTTFGGGNTQYTWPNISWMSLELHLILVQATISGHN